jgi:hypothetical protein
MRPAAILVFLVCLLPSCLGDVSNDDASVPEDLASPRDLANLDLTGALTCLELNACTSACKNLMCVAACRDRASPQAKVKEADLQKCFNTYCPQEVDMGTAICKPDVDGNRSPACIQCITNTQKATATDCTPAGGPECTKCFNAAQTCKQDTK